MSKRTTTEEKRTVAKRASDKYRAAHPDRIKEGKAKFLSANPDYFVQYRKDHPDKFKAGQAKYVVDHPERVRESKRNGEHLRRVRKQSGVIEKFTEAEIFERDGWICQLCFESIDPELRNRHPRMASLDHVTPINKGGFHTRNNVQATHLQCNIRKGGAT